MITCLIVHGIKGAFQFTLVRSFVSYWFKHGAAVIYMFLTLYREGLHIYTYMYTI